MAEPKKKPTLRKAPKGSLSAPGGADEKTRKRAVKAALAEKEAEEKAAAKEAIEHAKEASKERKAQRKAQQKAAKAEEKQARAERKAQKKAEAAPAAAVPDGQADPEGTPNAAVAVGSGAEPPLAEPAEAPERLGSEAADGGPRPPRPQAAARTVRFVAGDDAYRMPEKDLAAEGPSRGRSGARRGIGWRKVLGIVLAALVAAIVIVAAVFSWNRWLRYDDAADFQGTWTYGEGGSLSVSFDGSTMVLTKDASYEYSLDTFAKTVTYRFGDLEGGGCYAFSEDRDTLVIVDGRAADVGSILGFVNIAENAGTQDDGTSSVIVLTRASDKAPAAVQQTQREQQAQQEDAASTSSAAEDVADAPSSSAASTQDGSLDEAAASGGSTGEGLDALGADPGSEAGSNVVTPEDLGIAPTEAEAEEP